MLVLLSATGVALQTAQGFELAIIRQKFQHRKDNSGLHIPEQNFVFKATVEKKCNYFGKVL